MTTEAPARAPAEPAHPARWVPTLYFAEGLPNTAVAVVAAQMFQSRGLPNDVIAPYTSLLQLPWSLKPLWSPYVEMLKANKLVVVLTQFLGGLGLALVALSLPLPGYFSYTIALLAVVAFCSATHDIAADGLYIASLTRTQQAAYAGWQSGFYQVAKIFARGGIVYLAGRLESRLGVVQSWLTAFLIMGAALALVAVYHSRVLPGGKSGPSAGVAEPQPTFQEIFVSFFQKPGIALLLLFVLLFYAGGAQIETIGLLFLGAARDTGGLGLARAEVGTIYGVFGTVGLIAGGVAGGYFAARLGLKRALFPLVCTVNVPSLVFFYLSAAQPESPVLITAAVVLESFCVTFGYVGLTLVMMQEIAPGKYLTAHYAFASATMMLTRALFGGVSGAIQTWVGYELFFLWTLAAALPAIVLSRCLPIRGGAGG
jgi:PAT family beta-lactamase induction signal transducer AmpG